MEIMNYVFQVGPSRKQTAHSNGITRGELNKGTVYGDLGGMQGSLKGQCCAPNDSGSRYHPQVCMGRAAWQEL